MEREVSYYINIGRDSARAQQSAKDQAVEVRQREGPSTRQLQDRVEGNVWEMSCRTCDNVCSRLKVGVCVWQLPKAASERKCEEEYREVHYGLNHWSLPPRRTDDCPQHTQAVVFTFTAHPHGGHTVCIHSTLAVPCSCSSHQNIQIEDIPIWKTTTMDCEPVSYHFRTS